MSELRDHPVIPGTAHRPASNMVDISSPLRPQELPFTAEERGSVNCVFSRRSTACIIVNKLTPIILKSESICTRWMRFVSWIVQRVYDKSSEYLWMLVDFKKKSTTR